MGWDFRPCLGSASCTRSILLGVIKGEGTAAAIGHSKSQKTNKYLYFKSPTTHLLGFGKSLCIQYRLDIMKSIIRKVYPLVLCALLCACSAASKKTMSAKIPNENWWQSAGASKTENSPEKNLATVRQSLRKVVPFSFTVGLADSPEINAYADLQGEQRYVIFTMGFISQFGNDPDVLATVLGHELAHHQLGHTQADYAKDRDFAIDATSQALGMIASYFIPFSGLVVSNATKGVGLSFSRDDERAADLQGMQWALQAGYSPCGSYRFAAKMNDLGEGASIAFLSTHPGNNERMESANQFAHVKMATLCDSSFTSKNSTRD